MKLNETILFPNMLYSCAHTIVHLFSQLQLCNKVCHKAFFLHFLVCYYNMLLIIPNKYKSPFLHLYNKRVKLVRYSFLAPALGL